MTTTLRLSASREKKTSMPLPKKFKMNRPTYVWISCTVWSVFVWVLLGAHLGTAEQPQIYYGIMMVPPVIAATLAWAAIVTVYGFLSLLNLRSKSHTVLLHTVILGVFTVWGVVVLACASDRYIGGSAHTIADLKAYATRPTSHHSYQVERITTPNGVKIKLFSPSRVGPLIDCYGVLIAGLCFGWWLVLNLAANLYVMINVPAGWTAPIVDHYRPPTKEPLGSRAESADGTVV